MAQLQNLKLVPIGKYDCDWVALCLDGALIYKKWKFDAREDKTLLPIVSKEVNGNMYKGRFWWTNKESNPCSVESASYLAISIQSADDSLCEPRVLDTLSCDLFEEVENLKPGTIADLPFDAGGNCVEQ